MDVILCVVVVVVVVVVWILYYVLLLLLLYGYYIMCCCMDVPMGKSRISSLRGISTKHSPHSLTPLLFHSPSPPLSPPLSFSEPLPLLWLLFLEEVAVAAAATDTPATTVPAAPASLVAAAPEEGRSTLTRSTPALAKGEGASGRNSTASFDRAT